MNSIITENKKTDQVYELIALLKNIEDILTDYNNYKENFEEIKNSVEGTEIHVLSIKKRDEELFEYLVNNIKMKISKTEEIVLSHDQYEPKRTLVVLFTKMIRTGLENGYFNDSQNPLYWYYALQLHQLVEFIALMQNYNDRTMVKIFVNYSLLISQTTEEAIEVKFYNFRILKKRSLLI
jgi:hypothetical protein